MRGSISARKTTGAGGGHKTAIIGEQKQSSLPVNVRSVKKVVVV